MPAVFINYRREESAGEARALYNDLVDHLGEESVFMDVDSIAVGQDFREVVQQRLASCDVMLSLVGKQWVDVTTSEGRRRLDDPRDFVRLEIEGALKRNIRLAPVLLHGTRMPLPEQLPESIRDFAYRNAFELSHTRWESDVQEMLRRLGMTPRAAGDRREAGASSSGGSRRALVLAAAAVVIIVALAGAYARWGSSEDGSPDLAVDEAGTTQAPPEPLAGDAQPVSPVTPAADETALVPTATQPTSASDDDAPDASREETPPIPMGIVRLGTQLTGADVCLDRLAMAPCRRGAAQIWRLVSAGEGIVRVHNQLAGPGKCLDIENDGANDQLTMADCGDYSGQSWNVTWAGPRNRFVHLRTAFTGPDRCLAVASQSSSAQVRMVPCNNVAAQRWEIRRQGN